MTPFTVGPLAGWIRPAVSGDEGRQVLLLHGGPGLDHDYMRWLADDLPAWTCASFQQRGLPPSTTDGPFDIPTAVADVATVLDALADRGWSRPLVAGHSWGGHLALHVGAALGDRVGGLLLIDTLGVVGDMGLSIFESELRGRLDEAALERIEELDVRDEAMGLTPAEDEEALRIFWPAYFASRANVYPFPGTRLSEAAFDGLMASAHAMRAELEAALPALTVPVSALAGERSPMPVTASTDAVALVPGGRVEVVEGAGHFLWHEAPGAVGAALERLRRT